MTTATAVKIICPAWCIVPTSEHLVELDEWDGAALHYGDQKLVGRDVAVRLAESRLPTGARTGQLLPRAAASRS